MKTPIRPLLCWLLLLSIPALAQHPLTSENSIPTIGTKIFKQQTTVAAPGIPGIGKVWDFSNIAPLEKAYEITYSLSISRQPHIQHRRQPDPILSYTGKR